MAYEDDLSNDRAIRRLSSPTILRTSNSTISAILNLSFWVLLIWGMPIVTIALKWKDQSTPGIDTDAILHVNGAIAAFALILRWLAKGIFDRRTLPLMIGAVFMALLTAFWFWVLYNVVTVRDPGWALPAILSLVFGLLSALSAGVVGQTLSKPPND